MCTIHVVIAVFILALVLFLWNRSEHFQDISIDQMTPEDIGKLRQHIERAVQSGQFYADFRRMYPYIITPWQFSTMVSHRKLGELDDTKIKYILKK